MATLEALVARIDERTEWIVCELKKSREKDGEFYTRIGSLERFRARMKGIAAAAVFLISVLALLAAFGCATPAYVTRARPDNQIEVRIVNDNWLQAKMYGVYGGGSRERLISTDLRGIRTELNAARMNAGFRFQVVLFASRQTWTSENITWARPGDCIEVRVNAQLQNSTVVLCGL